MHKEGEPLGKSKITSGVWCRNLSASLLFGLATIGGIGQANAQQDSATLAAISARDTLLLPKRPTEAKIRAERREHVLAASGVVLMAGLTFLLYSLRSR
jgi:hypothetical protein